MSRSLRAQLEQLQVEGEALKAELRELQPTMSAALARAETAEEQLRLAMRPAEEIAALNSAAAWELGLEASPTSQWGALLLAPCLLSGFLAFLLWLAAGGGAR